VIDFSAEKTRLDKELAKADADIKRVDASSPTRSCRQRAGRHLEEEKENAKRRWRERLKILEALGGSRMPHDRGAVSRFGVNPLPPPSNDPASAVATRKG